MGCVGPAGPPSPPLMWLNFFLIFAPFFLTQNRAQKKWVPPPFRTPWVGGGNPALGLQESLVGWAAAVFFRLPGTDEQSIFAQVGLQFMALLFLGVMFADTIQGLDRGSHCINAPFSPPVFYVLWSVQGCSLGTLF